MDGGRGAEPLSLGIWENGQGFNFPIEQTVAPRDGRGEEEEDLR